MSSLPMLENICGQPASHRSVIQLQHGEQYAKLAACADRIRDTAGRIFFTGMGASFFAALPAVSRLEQQGFRVHAVESSELLHYGSRALQPSDLGILISRSGRSAEVLRLANTMRAAGMTVIGVTNIADGPLQQVADLTLLIGAHADQLIAVQTYTGTVLTLLLLAEQVLSEGSAQFGNACSAALPTLSAYIEESLRGAESWRELMDGPGALYLLGRGPALASAHEGALLMHETAKTPAIGLSSGQFRHGPVEVVSDQFRAIVFGTSPQTRTIDRALAEDLVSMGAKVRWIGPAKPPRLGHGEVEPLVTWPELGPAFAPMLASLFEIVPVQVAAYTLALWRGITPGDFRYASEVTSEESGFPLFREKLSRAEASLS